MGDSTEDRAKSPTTFVHLADLHLAPRARSIAAADPVTGRPMRDIDMDRAFEGAVGDILAQDPLPSAVVIAGDVFDTWRGSIDAMVCAMTQIRRIRSAGVAVVGIAGNHDTPTRRASTCMYQLLAETMAGDGGVTLAYDEVAHVGVGDVEYVLLPHRPCIDASFSQEDLEPSLGLPRSVLVVHGVAAGDPALRQMDEAREVPIAAWVLDMGWDYVAFGHFHKPGWIPGREGKASYCGSLENTVISGPDVCMERGPVYIDLSVNGEVTRVMHPLPIRRIVTLPAVEVGGDGGPSTPEEIDEAVARAIREGDTGGAIVRIEVRGIPRQTYRALPRRSFASEDPTALTIRIDWTFADALGRPPAALAAPNEGGEGDAEAPVDADLDGDAMTGHLLPLDSEAELMLDRMVADGRVPADRRDDILARIAGYMG